MTRRRWIADEVSGRRAALTGDHATHLIRVLRARLGQQFDVVAGGVVYRGRISGIDDRRVDFDLEEELPSPPAAQIAILLSVIKFDRMEWAIEKCTELGVARFIPLIAARTDSKLASAAQKRVERWQRIAREAAEQSRRPSLPEIAEPIKSKAAVSLPAATRIILSETEQTQALSKVLLSNSPNDDVMVAIGPEGGWTSDEDHLFRKAGWIAASLGPTILRAETASIAAIAIMMSKMA